ncbi:MAG: pilus assembly PilX N-terminal domain-containing protein [Burkholderiales bacterium]|nr:pilus assembly PilX N-terminal domain-containing protein [Burkholderiales bacterium]
MPTPLPSTIQPIPRPAARAAPRAAAHPRRRQRGAGALGVTVLLLLTMSVVALYLNRGLLFEQRTSANQLRATQAFEAAEAGIEWATGMLNAPQAVDAACTLSAASASGSFRRRYLLTDATTTDFAIATTVLPGCKVDGGVLTACSCPAVPGSGTAVAALGAAQQPGFTVRFETVVTDPATGATDHEAVRVVAWGCAAQAGACTAASAADPNADGVATVSTIVKLAPALRAAPATPLTCGLNCNLSGSYNIVNLDPLTNGMLVNAGETVTQGGGVTLTTLPGMPAQNSIVATDDTLKNVASADADCSNSGIFQQYFGAPIEEYASSPSTKKLSCGSSADCTSKLLDAYDDGWRSFFFESDVQLAGNHTLGSTLEPVILVTENNLKITGTWEITGLIFSNNSEWDNLGTGSSKLNGAQLSCANYKNNGNGTITYDPDALRNARRMSATLVRVPGSWRDW